MSHDVKKNLSTTLGVALAIVVAVAAIFVPQHRARARRDACLNNLRQLEGAAMSYCLENKLPFDKTLTPEAFSAYLLPGRDGAPAICPSGTAPYSSFNVLHGPRCPNSTEHNRIFVTKGCRGEKAAVWAAALSRGAARGLSWTDSIDPKEITIGFYCGKCTGTCPLGTNGYPPFVLASGPHCPLSAEHNAAQGHPWRNGEFFDKHGNANTNLSLSAVDTNSWSVWIERRTQSNH